MTELFSDPSNYRVQIYLSISFATSVIGLIASVFTVLIIRKIYPMTTHVHLILYMSIYQGIYNAFFFFMEGSAGERLQYIALFFTILCGVASSIMSNWIAYALFSTVYFRKKFDVFKHLATVHMSAFLPGILLAIIYTFVSVPGEYQSATLQFSMARFVYSSVRSLSIFLNFALIIATGFLVSSIYGKSIKQYSAIDVAIITLCRRIILYPIIQAIGRSGCAWYEAAYGLNYDPTHPSNLRFASLIYMAIAMPLVSLGYFLVFLWMQPNAWIIFKRILYLDKLCCPSNADDLIVPLTAHDAANTHISDVNSSRSGTIYEQSSEYMDDLYYLEQELSVTYSFDVAQSTSDIRTLSSNFSNSLSVAPGTITPTQTRHAENSIANPISQKL